MDRTTLAIFAGTALFLLAACSSPGPQTAVLYPPKAGTIPTPPRDLPLGEPDTSVFCWSDSLGGYFPGEKQCDPRYDSVSASEFRERREAKALAAFFEAYPDAANENFLADHFEMAATGTAFFVTADGYLITNKHVVEGCDVMTLIASDALHSVVVIDTDDRDLALLKASLHVDRYALFTMRELRVGENVYAIGYPMLGYLGGLIVTDGIVSSLHGPPDSPQYIQISAPIQPGNSGGPLFDQYGTIAGVVTAKDFEVGDTTLEGVGYAIRPTLVGGFMLANGLDPLLLASEEFSTPSIVEYASAFTVPVACWVKKKQP